MKTTALLAGCILAVGLQLSPVHADTQPTAFEKALYQKARYRVLSALNDQDFVSYCVTMNVGGETLLKLHDEILAKQTDLAELVAQGLPPDDQKVMALNAVLKNLKSQYGVKITEARRGFQVEARIAEETLSNLPQR